MNSLLKKLSSLSFGIGAILATGCSTAIGPSHPWVNWQEIDGVLRPEVSPPPVDAVPGDQLRIATFNVHYGENVEEIARALRENRELARTDIFFLQEIQSFPTEPGSRASRLAAALGMGYAYAPARIFESGTHGVAILSRFPLDRVAVMELPLGDLKVDIERRVAVSADIQTAHGVLHLVNVHLDTRLNSTQRILQLRPAVIDIPSPLIVGGDFNMNPVVWAFNLVPILPLGTLGGSDQAPIVDEFMRTLGFLTPSSELGATVEYPILNPRIDAIYTRGVSDGSGAVERGVSVSDHWPVWQDVTLGFP